MPAMTIILDGDGTAEPGFKEALEAGRVHRVEDFVVAALAGGMKSGAPSVFLQVALPDGSYVFAETSLALFLSAADAFKARHGDPRTGERGLAQGSGERGRG